jgi:hypothetical protein
MAIQIVPYTAGLEAAVQRFNRRMESAKAPAEFGIPETPPPPRPAALVRAENFLAVDSEGEVRGGVIVLEHPGWVGGKVETVLNLQSPLSEGIIDPKYSLVAIQLIRFAVKRSPYVYIVGMGSEQNPLPRLLKAAGWTVRPVPFYFRMLRPNRCLKQLRPLQHSLVMRVASMMAAMSGTGWLALKLLQRASPAPSGLRAERISSTSAADDEAWARFRERCSFAVLRDAATLPLYCRKDILRFQLLRDQNTKGWFSLLPAQMRGHRYFGDLKIVTLMDVLCMDPADTPAAVALAVQFASSIGCDLIVSNHMHHEIRSSLRTAGFLQYRSNYLFGTSKALSDKIRDDTALVSRQDGDGLVNLSSPEPGN